MAQNQTKIFQCPVCEKFFNGFKNIVVEHNCLNGKKISIKDGAFYVDDQTSEFNLEDDYVIDNLEDDSVTENLEDDSVTENLEDDGGTVNYLIDDNFSETLNTKDHSASITWPNVKVLALIDLWRQSEKKFKLGSTSNKTIWIDITEKLIDENFAPTWQQVQNKWKGMIRTYKRIKDNNNSTGRGYKKWLFFNNMNEVLEKKPEISPLSKASSSKGFRSQLTLETEPESLNDITANENFVSVSPAKIKQPNKPTWVGEILDAQEKRHKENMASREKSTNKICNILEKFLEKF